MKFWSFSGGPHEPSLHRNPVKRFFACQGLLSLTRAPFNVLSDGHQEHTFSKYQTKHAARAWRTCIDILCDEGETKGLSKWGNTICHGYFMTGHRYTRVHKNIVYAHNSFHFYWLFSILYITFIVPVLIKDIYKDLPSPSVIT